jgi:hypothetical protein
MDPGGVTSRIKKLTPIQKFELTLRKQVKLGETTNP